MESETEMSYVLKGLLLFGFSFVWAAVNHFLYCWGLTCRIVRGAGLEGKPGKRGATEPREKRKDAKSEQTVK